MALVYSAVIAFSSTKTCFLVIPERWLEGIHSSKDLIVLKVLYGGKKEAFLSCKTQRNSTFNPRSESEVYLNGKYAENLGLKNKEKVCIQILESNASAAEKVFVEPLNMDYWEIMFLNNKNIELNLLNQIRVIWKDQIFPVWVQQSSLLVKVAIVVPDIQPVLLEEFTEVHIRPIKRSEPSDFNISAQNRDEYRHLQYKHLQQGKSKSIASLKQNIMHGDLEPVERTDSCTFDAAGNTSGNTMFSILRYVVSSVFASENEHFNIELPLNEWKEEFVALNFDVCLRVIPFSRINRNTDLSLSLQATTVFISSSTYGYHTGMRDIPLNFVAKLTKFLSPLDKNLKKRSVSSSQNNEITKGNKKQSNIEKDTLTEENAALFDSVCVNVIIIQTGDETKYNVPKSLFYSRNLIVVPKELKRSLGLHVCSIVRCQSVQMRAIPLKRLVLCPVSTLPSNIEEGRVLSAFKNWADENILANTSLIMSDGTIVKLQIGGTEKDFFVNLRENLNISAISSSSVGNISSSSNTKKSVSFINGPLFGYFDKNTVTRINLKISNQMSSSIRSNRPCMFKIEDLYQKIPTLDLGALGGIKELADRAMEFFEFWLKLRPLSYISNHPSTCNGCLLICGPKGVGKSTLAKALSKKLMKYPYYVFVTIVECLPLRGKRVDTIVKNWDTFLNEGIRHQPSLLLFEDLDYIASSSATPEQSVGPDGLYFATIVEAFINLINKIVESGSQVAIVVTSKSMLSLNPSLMNIKGRHIFEKVLECQPPNALQREDILKSLVISKHHISENTLQSISWHELALKTEGFVAQDLDSLINRATHAAWFQNESVYKLECSDGTMCLRDKDFQKALEDYTPGALRGISLQTQDQKNWNNVGGLLGVKEVIQQVITWPIKYKEMFKNYMLKPQSNILLYGAPGTGKTLLAGVVANECGLNFISIKGPELLSKYIGASEQAVRDLFLRASSAKPCILFFDEFDSIAPRRGHDSTGVTDRVVNQLLTQLDGVESLEGVHVLAATSRPELIDPALLRPGRLDKCVLCPLPDRIERLDILTCLSSKLPLQEDVDFEPIVDLTEHFSGADLQALLYTAHIEALHDVQSIKPRKPSINLEDASYSIAKEKFLYMPTLEEGLCTSTYEEGKKIVQEVSVVMNNFMGVKEGIGKHSRHGTLSFSINQKHLLKVVSKMKPSVSLQEQFHYLTVFEKFRSSLRGSSSVSSKRVTLA